MLQYIWPGNLTVPITRFFNLFLSYYLYAYLVMFILFWFVVLKDKTTLEMQYLVWSIWPLKNVNISFFLSFLLKLLTNIRTPGTPGLFGVVKNLALTVIITLSMTVCAWELIFQGVWSSIWILPNNGIIYFTKERIYQIQIHEWKLNPQTHAHTHTCGANELNYSTVFFVFLYTICSSPHLSHVQQNLVFHLSHAESTNTEKKQDYIIYTCCTPSFQASCKWYDWWASNITIA